ncbi:unnamed protein product, partial [marine sediment metagenome]
MCANKEQFLFAIEGLNAVLYLRQFTSSNYNLAVNYRFEIIVTTKNLLPDITERNCKLILLGENKNYVHGIVTNWTHSEANIVGVYTYTVIMQSPLYSLTKIKHNRVFKNLTIIEIVKKILKDYRYEIKVNNAYPAYKLMVQYQESDFDFLVRILNRAGLFYVFRQQNDQAILLIVDDINALAKFSKIINYRSPTGANRTEDSIYSFYERRKLEQQLFFAVTDCRDLQLGQLLTLRAHPVSKYNTAYRVVGMKINIEETKLFLQLAAGKYQLPKIDLHRFYHLLEAAIESDTKYANL